MFKNLFKLISLTLVFISMFSITSFANAIPLDENIDNNSLKVEMTSSAYISDEGILNGIALFSSAAPVTNISCKDIYIKTGRVYVVMEIIGYGDRYVTYDGKSISYSSIGYLGYSPIYGIVETYDCGLAYVGNHRFTFQTTSYNSPWNTKSGYIDFSIN